MNEIMCQFLTVGKIRKTQNLVLRRLLVTVLLALTPAFTLALDDQIQDVTIQNPDSVQALKKSVMELNRDLLVLEEELLFPEDTQIVVFISLNVGKFFDLDSVKVTIDDQMVASHLYTKRQNQALSKGGIQRLYTGNLKNGVHELTAIFTGVGPDNREYKRGTTYSLEKDGSGKMIEIQIKDSTTNMQPEFDIKEWEL